MSRQKLLPSSDGEPDEEAFMTIRQFESTQQNTVKLKAVIYANYYALFQAGFLLGSKYCFERDIQVLDLTFCRYFVSLFISFFLMKYNNKEIFTEIDSIKKHQLVALRTLLCFMAFVSFILSVPLIPTFFVALIERSSVCVAAVLGFFILGDKLYLSDFFAILFGYLGVALIILGNKQQQDSEDESENNFLLGIVLIMITTFCVAGVFIASRKLRDVHYTVLCFHLDFFASLVIACTMIFLRIQGRTLSIASYSAFEYSLLLVLGMAASLSILFQTLSMQLEKAGVVGVIFYTQVVYNFLGDIVLFKVVFNLWQIVGGLLILATNITMTLLQTKKVS